MQKTWIVFLFFLSLTAMNSYSMTISTQIKEIEVSLKIHEPTLVFLASGQVAKVYPNNVELLDQILAAKQEHSWLKVKMDDERVITQLEMIEPVIPSNPDDDFYFDKSLTAEEPTVLSSMSLAKTLFTNARYLHKESQCFNRAHIWSYEWKTKNHLNTSKMFLFFSVKYIREHDFHWWFHIAPYVHVAVGTEIKERVMDKKYMSGPGSKREWINRFIEDGTKCRTVKTYSEYANYPESGICYIMRTNMYTYWPLDLELEELKGTKKKGWMPEEIKSAYSEAFNITL